MQRAKPVHTARYDWAQAGIKPPVCPLIHRWDGMFADISLLSTLHTSLTLPLAQWFADSVKKFKWNHNNSRVTGKCLQSVVSTPLRLPSNSVCCDESVRTLNTHHKKLFSSFFKSIHIHRLQQHSNHSKFFTPHLNSHWIFINSIYASLVSFQQPSKTVSDSEMSENRIER